MIPFSSARLRCPCGNQTQLDHVRLRGGIFVCDSVWDLADLCVPANASTAVNPARCREALTSHAFGCFRRCEITEAAATFLVLSTSQRRYCPFAVATWCTSAYECRMLCVVSGATGGTHPSLCLTPEPDHFTNTLRADWRHFGRCAWGFSHPTL